MPLVSLKLKAGINTVQSPTLNELGWSAASNVRFFQGLPQKDGGFVDKIKDPTIGIIRALKAWTSTVAGPLNWLAVGGTDKLVVWNSVTESDISPTPFPGIASSLVTMDNWGGIILVCYTGGPVYVWTPPTITAATNVATAPQVSSFIFIAVQQQMLICCGAQPLGGGPTTSDPMLVRWSDVGDYTSFTPTVSNQAGSFRLSIGSLITAGLVVPGMNLLWTDLALYSMQYIQFPLVWGFQPVGLNCGALGPHSVGVVGGSVFWMSRNQFFTLSSGSVQMLECPVWDSVFPNLDVDAAVGVACETDSFYGEVGWSVPQVDGSFIFVRLQIQTGAWTASSYHHHTAWLDQNQFGAPLGGHEDGTVDQHDVGYDADRVAAPWSLTSGMVMISEGDEAVFVRDLIWDLETQGTAPTAKVILEFYDYPNSPPRVHGPYTLTDTTTVIHPRGRGRGVRFLFSGDTSNANLGAFVRLGNVRYRAQPDGRR
jgi:hypothetical protein